MRSVLIILISFLFLCISSCTKVGRNITVKGKVVNPLTNNTYEGIKVQLVRTTNFQLPGGFKEFKHTHTDANGEFELSASRLGDVWLQAQSGSDLHVLGWHQEGEYISSNFRTRAQKRKTMEADFHVVPYSFAKLIINNLNCQGPDDLFVLFRENQLGTIDDTFGWEHEGCVYWETNGYSEILMGEVYYRWEVTRSGNTEVFYDTVFYPPGENITYEINY